MLLTGQKIFLEKIHFDPWIQRFFLAYPVGPCKWSVLTSCTNTYSIALFYCFRLQLCTVGLHVFCFTTFKRCPTHIISSDLHGTMLHLLQSLLGFLIVNQGCILCKSSRFILFQFHVKCQDDNEFFWAYTSM